MQAIETKNMVDILAYQPYNKWICIKNSDSGPTWNRASAKTVGFEKWFPGERMVGKKSHAYFKVNADSG